MKKVRHAKRKRKERKEGTEKKLAKRWILFE
jgi:hypothetical protein